jgi:anti-sigma B factor antagonist
MQLEAEICDDALVVHVNEPRIDAAVAIRFKDLMRDIVQQGGARVVLDLSQVGFLDSSGLGAVVAVMKSLAPSRRLDLAALTPNVERVFHLTRMDTVFRIHATLGAALSDGVRDAG